LMRPRGKTGQYLRQLPLSKQTSFRHSLSGMVYGRP
jgi:hypothetical protein